ncbi:MAG TPA: hypothetical protein VHF92_08775, partial [Geodermatophilus sp.]|nr:hypothetical protein [Geodermatophilus sp.]
APLPSPAVLRYGLRAVVDPGSPVYLPLSGDPSLWRFLVSFARHCTHPRWRRAMQAYLPLNEQALEAFDDLAAVDAVELLGKAPDPRSAARLTRAQITTALRRARRRDLEAQTAAIAQALRTPHWPSRRRWWPRSPRSPARWSRSSPRSRCRSTAWPRS